MWAELKKTTHTILDWLGRVITQPRSELTRWQRTARFAYDLGNYGARQLRQDRAGQMAAAMSFRTLFALIPVMIVGTILVRVFRGTEEWSTRLSQFFENLGWHLITVGSSEAADGSTVATQTMSDWAMGLFDQIDKLNFAAIGWVGVLVVVYSAIGLMVTIENSFNMIYRAPEGRTWTRRVPLYWTVLTLGPLAIALTLFFSSQLGGWMDEHDMAPIVKFMASLWSFVAIWLVMFAGYKLVPNTSVAMQPALVGSCVAAMFVAIGQRFLGAYFQNAVSFSQLLGSLGLVPVFMFWVYMMWLIVLFGLELSKTLQMLGGRSLEEMEYSRGVAGLVDPAAVVTLMEVVARHFEDARPVTSRDISEQARMPESTVLMLLDRLGAEGLVHRLDREDAAVSLARPPDRITADELIELGYEIVDEGAGKRSSFLERLREVQRNIAAESTLAMLAAARPAPEIAEPRAGDR